MPRLPEFRENAARAVLISGEINEELVHRITLDICRFRGDNAEPITVYINSPGGIVYYAEQIRSLLNTPDQDGNVCRVVTVATCHAHSAAAGLLALGDYAIAYPQAVIHCHGFRLASNEITTERAENLAASLKQDDDAFALKLARRTFQRMAFHFANLRDEFPEIKSMFLKEKPESEEKSDFECFAFLMASRLSDAFRSLPTDAFFRHKRLLSMAEYIFEKEFNTPENDPFVKNEAELLTRLLQYEMKERDENSTLATWSLQRGGVDELVLDFKSFSDFLWGSHHRDLEDHLDRLGVYFLSPEEIKNYQALLAADHDKAAEFLKEIAKPLVQPMWYFVVSLCRLLQSGEYSLSATDAYWLGIVDEVIGEKLMSLRLIAENP